MGFSFQRASKKSARLRAALCGPAGSGKTFTALSLASHLVPNARVAVIDTEHGSASKYADRFAFDVLELDSFSPKTYVEAIHAAEAAGYDVLIIDSLSHAWMGKDGALEQVDRAAKRSQSGNSFMAWRDITPMHNALVEAMIASNCHVIATLRAKSEYVIEENDRGKKMPRKIGLAPIQRDGLEFEFDLFAEINQEHELIVGKTRCADVDGGVYPKAGKELAAVLSRWLGNGPVETKATPKMPEPTALDRMLDDLTSVETADALRTVWKTYAKDVMEMDEAGDETFIRRAKDAMFQCATSQGLARTKAELAAILRGPPPPKGDGPKGGKHSPEASEGAEAHGDSYEGADAAAASDLTAKLTESIAIAALAKWERHVATKTNQFELAASFWKHENELAEAGVRDEALRVTANALLPLLQTDSESAAVAFMRTHQTKRKAA
jgi:hypothetical protein